MCSSLLHVVGHSVNDRYKSRLPNSFYADFFHMEVTPNRQLALILANLILKTFDNPDYQNLDKEIFESLRPRDCCEHCYQIVEPCRCIEILSESFSKYIAREFKQNTLVKWIVGYELSKANRNDIEVQLYWLVMDSARAIIEKFMTPEEQYESFLRAEEVKNRLY